MATSSFGKNRLRLQPSFRPGPSFIRLSIAALCASFSAGCVTTQGPGGAQQGGFLKETFASDDPCASSSRNTGILLGAIGGALLGKAVSDDKKNDRNAMIVGAGVGAVVGGLIGADMDRKRCELSKIAKKHNLDMQFATIRSDGSQQAAGTSTQDKNGDPLGQTITVRSRDGDGGHFESDSAQLTPKARQYFAEIARQFNPDAEIARAASPQDKDEIRKLASRRKLMLVGHTDDTGNSKYNADLSERRARAVAQFLKENGVPKTSLYYQGAGETQPIADNNTPDGRVQNRRVEIVQVDDREEGFKKYIENRRPNYALYRPNEPKPSLKPEPAAKPGKPAKTTHAAALFSGINFGGHPFQDGRTGFDIGMRPERGFSLISKAYADKIAPSSNCMHDRPRVAGAVKSLKDDSTVSTSYLTGLYGKNWVQSVNGHLVALKHVLVPRDESAPVPKPDLVVYRDYNPAKNANHKPSVQINADVNVYRGTQGMLYRVFTTGQQGIQCVDIAFPPEGGYQAKAGMLIYQRPQGLWETEFRPQTTPTALPGKKS